MAFSLILSYLEQETTLRRTTDIYEAFLPEDVKEGVQVRIPLEASEDTFEEDIVIITLFYYKYTTAKTNARAIFDALKAHRGSLGSTNTWTIVGKIAKEYAGQDDQRRHIFEIRCNVRH